MIIRKNFLGIISPDSVEKVANSSSSSLLAMNAVESFPDPVSQVAEPKTPTPVRPRVWGGLGS